ncbi:hypothetical protein ACWET9_37900 [Streptomyces sp. NPDC004059]
MAAIEAVWDGDTVHDWFVCLVAVLEEPDSALASPDVPDDEAPRWPQVQRRGGSDVP